jgi:phage terminase small subunit
MTKSVDTLTDKAKRFVDLLLSDEKMQKKQAAIEAGYNKKNAASIASQLLSRPNVQAYMQQRMESRQARTEINQDYVLRKLVKTLEISLGEKPMTISKVMEDGTSKKVQIIKPNLTASNKSLELLGRHMGMYKDMSEVTSNSSLEKTLMDIAKENAANRKSLLPKDNIDFDKDEQ